MAESGGTVVRGSDGAVYFIRDEVLEACRVEGEYAEHVDQLLESDQQEVEGFAFNVQSFGPSSTTQLQPVAYVSGDLISPSGNRLDFNKVASTVMCPW